MKKYTNPELEMIRFHAEVTSVSLGGELNLATKQEGFADTNSPGGTKTYGGLDWNINQ